jgi:hypothetical protein
MWVQLHSFLQINFNIILGCEVFKFPFAINKSTQLLSELITVPFCTCNHTRVWSEVLKAMSTKMAVFWVVGPCRLTALMMEAVNASGTLVDSYKSTRRYNPEDGHHLSYTCSRSLWHFIRHNTVHGIRAVGKGASYWGGGDGVADRGCCILLYDRHLQPDIVWDSIRYVGLEWQRSLTFGCRGNETLFCINKIYFWLSVYVYAGIFIKKLVNFEFSPKDRLILLLS